MMFVLPTILAITIVAKPPVVRSTTHIYWNPPVNPLISVKISDGVPELFTPVSAEVNIPSPETKFTANVKIIIIRQKYTANLR
jgi:hypothetical protein